MKQEKVERVATLTERIEGSEGMLITEYRGMSVHDTSELRRSLSGTATFGVVKNTLLRRAAERAGVDAEINELLTGPTAVAFVQGDVVAAAKKVAEAAKSFPALVIKGAWIEGRVLREAEAKALADLDTREVMLSKVAGLMKGEMVRAASMFQTLQGRFLSLLEAYKEKVPAGTPAPEAAAAPPAPEASAASADEGAPADASVDDGTASDAAPSTEEPAAEADGDGREE